MEEAPALFRTGRIGTVALVFCLLAACSTGSPGSSNPMASPTASASPAGLDCGPLDLRMPDGTRIDLTGIWEGADTTYYLRQSGDCVWGIALSSSPNQAPGAYYSMTLSAHLSDDFTLSGVEATIVTPNGIRGNVPRQLIVSFTVSGASAASGEPIVLIPPEEAVSACGCPVGTLHYVGALPASVSP